MDGRIDYDGIDPSLQAGPGGGAGGGKSALFVGLTAHASARGGLCRDVSSNEEVVGLGRMEGARKKTLFHRISP
jgi:hypothetical protein